MNKLERACVLVLLLPLLDGCAAAIIAAQAVPSVIGGISVAGAEDRSPFRTHIPEAGAHADTKRATMDEQIRRAECGIARSQYWVASALQNKLNTAPNSVEIYKWYRLAEIGGYAPASEKLAALYQTMSAQEVATAKQRVQDWRAATEECPADA